MITICYIQSPKITIMIRYPPSLLHKPQFLRLLEILSLKQNVRCAPAVLSALLRTDQVEAACPKLAA